MKSNSLNSIVGREYLNGIASNLVELLPLAAYTVRAPDGVIIWFNSRAAQLWGRVPVIGDTDERFCGAHTLYHADGTYMAHCDTPVAVALQTGASVHEEEVVIERPDGSRVTVSVHIDPIRDKDGAIIGVVNFFDDITERKQAEKAIRESEDRLRTLAQGLESQVRLRTQQLEERNTEVVQQREELRELSSRLLVTQDEERRRIARDLHDSAGQIVTAVGLQLASISERAVKPEVRKAAQESRKMLQQLSKEIRTVSYLLHPPLLDETGLSQAIRWYIQGLVERSGLKIDLDIPEDFGRLPDDLEVAIFRIVQEGLTNIHRHSGGKAAAIRLSHNISTVSLEIQDDGRGIPKQTLAAIQTEHSGVGITGMRERVRHLGGNLDIQSDSNGTKTSVRLPILTNSVAHEDIHKATAAGQSS